MSFANESIDRFEPDTVQFVDADFYLDFEFHF